MPGERVRICWLPELGSTSAFAVLSLATGIGPRERALRPGVRRAVGCPLISVSLRRLVLLGHRAGRARRRRGDSRSATTKATRSSAPRRPWLREEEIQNPLAKTDRQIILPRHRVKAGHFERCNPADALCRAKQAS